MSGKQQRFFGAIPGVEVGDTFPARRDLSAARVHPPTMAGISGTSGEGADSIVLSGGYEDDADHGDVIVYTGHGGNDPETRRQVADQELRQGNLALARSCLEGLPVRVTRGERLDSPYRPPRGYRYDGLYAVETFWSERGRSGFVIWRYRLVRAAGQPPLPAPRVATVVQRIARNTAAARRVKELHDHRCQVCGERLADRGRVCR